MAAACLKDAYGLENNHAYTMLDAIVLTKAGQPYKKLVKMRNPWGTEAYTGPWRDGDVEWTPELRAQAGLVQKDDGIFYMPFDAFRNAFTQYSIAMFQEWKTDQKTMASSGQTFT